MNEKLFKLHCSYGKHVPRLVTAISDRGTEELWHCDCGAFFYVTETGPQMVCGVARGYISEEFLHRIKDREILRQWAEWSKICRKIDYNYQKLTDYLNKKYEIYDIREIMEGLDIVLAGPTKT